MTAGAVHLAWKDVRQHRAWLGAFLAIAALRALLIGSGIDAYITNPNLLASLGFTYLLLCILHFALVVVVAVQVVQADRLVGTTAFWLTRPVPRRSLLAAKLATVSIVLVVVPVVFDALVLATNRMAWLDVLGAVAEGALIRLAIVLPVMTLAAITSDLAVFVVAAVAAFFGTLALEAVFQWGHMVVWSVDGVPARNWSSAYSATLVDAAVIIACAVIALAYQVFTRRTTRTVLIVIGGVTVAALVANRWTSDLGLMKTGLQAGWLDPSRIVVTMKPLAPENVSTTNRKRPWLIRASYIVTGTTANVALVPLSVTTETLFGDGSREPFRAEVQQRVWDMLPSPPAFLRKDLVEALLVGTHLVNAVEFRPGQQMRPIASLTEEGHRKLVYLGAQFTVEVALGGIAYHVGAVLPLEGHGSGAAGDRRVSIQSATCEIGACDVVLRDAMAGFLVDLRRPSRVEYILVNQTRGQAVWSAERDYFSRYPVFGRASFALLGEHLAVTRRALMFKAPDSMPDMIDARWLQEASIAALEVRDIGAFTVEAKVVQEGRK